MATLASDRYETIFGVVDFERMATVATTFIGPLGVVPIVVEI